MVRNNNHATATGVAKTAKRAEVSNRVPFTFRLSSATANPDMTEPATMTVNRSNSATRRDIAFSIFQAPSSKTALADAASKERGRFRREVGLSVIVSLV